MSSREETPEDVIRLELDAGEMRVPGKTVNDAVGLLPEVVFRLKEDIVFISSSRAPSIQTNNLADKIQK
jgi:hypothetical protein